MTEREGIGPLPAPCRFTTLVILTPCSGVQGKSLRSTGSNTLEKARPLNRPT
jgi:hypothetical protein